MVKYRDKTTGEIFADLSSFRNSVSLPDVVDSEAVAALNLELVLDGEYPLTTEPWQTIVETGVKRVGDSWHIEYQIGPIFKDTENETADQQLQNYISLKTNDEWLMVRGVRGRKLADSDWTQLDDTPLTNTDKQLWASYRQALRDITTQADPFSIEWPVAP